jgi:hypothetical protein
MFFDDYPLFYESPVGASPNRLETRHAAMIRHNAHLIRGKRVLDLASHDGRWTLAALKMGAEHVVAVEGDKELVKLAKKNLDAYKCEGYELISGDAHKIRHLGSFDLVMCFGFFYHTIRHYDLLYEISQVSDCMILDTKVIPALGASIKVMLERTGPGSGINDGLGPDNTKISGIMTTDALEMFLKRFGYSYRYVDWKLIIDEHGPGGVEDYCNNERITVVAQR